MKYPSIRYNYDKYNDGHKSTQRRRLGTNINLQCVPIYMRLNIYYGMQVLDLLQFLVFAENMFGNDYMHTEYRSVTLLLPSV